MSSPIAVLYATLATLATLATPSCRARREPPASPLPAQPAAYVPSGASGILLADLTRVRTSRALRFLFEPGQGVEACATRLLRQVDALAIAIGDGNGDFGLAAQGRMRRNDLIDCARERAGGGGDVRNDVYRGAPLARVLPRRPPGVVARRGGAEIVYPPGGVVLVGMPETVRRMLDRAMAGPPTVSERDTPTQEMLSRVPDIYAVRFATRMLPGGVEDDARGGDRVFSHVAAVGIGASFERGLDAEMWLACDDFDAPRAVANALERIQRNLGTDLGVRALDALLERATIERRATEVRVRWRLEPDEFLRLADVLQRVIDELSRPVSALPDQDPVDDDAGLDDAPSRDAGTRAPPPRR